ncbi:MAG: right-handed parallel beta-helix repeat-containing protein [Candidatus Omnitrophica bacterium]|nr:right-handed parallel beta-helix repeat-containing protein [Candidatus Omnitrophota bacterium]MCB9768067.1 right-handed parallel beta-helix repeat-containing protein [Candidatus Omnitrophota bacterium]
MADVKLYGAEGDGVKDDTRSLQHAVDEGAGDLDLGSGVYRITQPIRIELAKTGYKGISGNRGTAKVIMAGPGPAFQVIGDHEGTAAPKSFKESTWEKTRFPVFTGFEILGEHPDGDGLELFRTMQATVSNVLIRKCRIGIRLKTRNRNFLLADSHIYECSDTGLLLDECNLHQTNIIGNHISYCARAGIRQYKGQPHNIQITGNDIEYNSGSDETSGEILLEAGDGEYTREFTIASNTIQATPDAKGANIRILGNRQGDPVGARLITITGNIIGNRARNIDIENASFLTLTGNIIYDGTELNANFKNCANIVLSSNTIGSREVDYTGEKIDGVRFEDCHSGMVTGNVFNDCWLGDKESGGAVTLKGCREIAVTNNQILDPLHRGVWIESSSGCRIGDNTILDRRPRSKMVEKIGGDGKGENRIEEG